MGEMDFSMTAMRQSIPDHDTEKAIRLYEMYAKPLEVQHEGEYVAVSARGETALGDDLLELVDRAVEQLGPGSYVFKIGDIAVGKWLCQTLVS